MHQAPAYFANKSIKTHQMTKKKAKNPEREAFKALLQTVEKFSDEDVDYLMEDLDKWGFFKMPASCRKHNCYEGGLVKHSLNVCQMAQILREQTLSIRTDLAPLLPMDSVIIASLLHDVCKSGIYQKVTLIHTADAMAANLMERPYTTL